VAVLDDVDRQILALLRRSGRMPVAEIARVVRLSPAPVARRIERMEADGIIRGYTAIVDDQLSGTLEAFTEIRLAGPTETSELEEILKDLPEVQSFYTIAGDPDALVRLRVDDADHLQRVVNWIRRTGKVASTKTLIVLYDWDRRTDAADCARLRRSH
jgi:Lrp/AsnC family leucine-responsive transcriptional regulator